MVGWIGVLKGGFHAWRRCCEEVKVATDFYRYTYSKDGLYQQCKACHARAGEIRLSRQGDPESKVPFHTSQPFFRTCKLSLFTPGAFSRICNELYNAAAKLCVHSWISQLLFFWKRSRLRTSEVPFRTSEVRFRTCEVLMLNYTPQMQNRVCTVCFSRLLAAMYHTRKQFRLPTPHHSQRINCVLPVFPRKG